MFVVATELEGGVKVGLSISVEGVDDVESADDGLCAAVSRTAAEELGGVGGLANAPSVTVPTHRKL